MHIYLFLILMSISAAFLLASFFIKNSDESDKYAYKLSCCLIAFIFFWILAPMAFDLTYVQEPQLTETIANYTYFEHIIAPPAADHFDYIWNITTTYTYGDPVVVHMSESWLFTYVCQGFSYVALIFMLFYSLAILYDLSKYSGWRR